MASSKRSNARTPTSASVCSGTRKTSGAPANSDRCSIRSWPLRGREQRREEPEKTESTEKISNTEDRRNGDQSGGDVADLKRREDRSRRRRSPARGNARG